MKEKKEKVKKAPKLPKEGGVKENALSTQLVPDEVKLKEVYKQYGMWRHFPSVMRDLTEIELRQKFGLEDQEMVRVLKIPTQGAFATEFKVDEKTLWAWNSKLDNDNPLPWIAMWAKQSTKNIVLANIQSAMGKGGVSMVDRQTFYKTIAGFEEKSTVKVEGLAEGILAALKAKKK